MVAHNTLLLKEFIFLIRFLVNKLDDHLIVLRPHPIEKKEDWVKLLNIDADNFIFGDQYTLIDWINISEVVINNGCMASVEAYFADKKIIRYNPDIAYKCKAREIETEFTKIFGVEIENKEKVLDYIISNKSIKKSTNHDTEFLKEVNYRLSFDSGYNFTHYIKVWDKLISFNKLETYKKINYKKFIKNNYFKILKIYVKKILSYLFPSNIKKTANPHIPFEHKFPEIDLNEVVNFKNLLSAKFNFDNKIQITKLDKHTIKISKH